MKEVFIEFGGVTLDVTYTGDPSDAESIEVQDAYVGGVDILPALLRASVTGSSGPRQESQWRVWLLDGLCEAVAGASK